MTPPKQLRKQIDCDYRLAGSRTPVNYDDLLTPSKQTRSNRRQDPLKDYQLFIQENPRRPIRNRLRHVIHQLSAHPIFASLNSIEYSPPLAHCHMRLQELR